MLSNFHKLICNKIKWLEFYIQQTTEVFYHTLRQCLLKTCQFELKMGNTWPKQLSSGKQITLVGVDGHYEKYDIYPHC